MQSTTVRKYILSYRSRETGLARAVAPWAWITGLSAIVMLLSLAATLAGILTGFGQQHHTFVTLRGETVTMQGGGLYGNESLSGASQAIGQDFVTLAVAIPLLVIATVLARNGSVRGLVLRAGVLLYFTYTYMLLAFGGAYNQLFLVYVAVYSAGLFAFILSVLAIDPTRLRARLSGRFRRTLVGWTLVGFAVLLALMWLGRIVPALASGTPPPGLESYGTLFVQAGDLGILVPLTTLSGVLLLMRKPAGFLLAGVMVVKGATFGLALMGMIVAMAALGAGFVAGEAAFFTALAIALTACALHYIACLPRVPGPIGSEELAS
jgi:hypothetical protein